MIKKYSLIQDKNKKLSTNFIVQEFACKDNSNTILVDTELVKILQNIRDHFNKPITITSGYRSPSYNKKIGGVSNSQHTKGTAADIIVKDTSPLEVAKYAEYLMPKSGGIGLYDSFTHIDTRAIRSRWQTKNNKETVVNGFFGYVPTSPLDNALEILINKGIISEPTKWKNKSWSKENMSCLIIKMAQYLNNL